MERTIKNLGKENKSLLLGKQTFLLEILNKYYLDKLNIGYFKLNHRLNPQYEFLENYEYQVNCQLEMLANDKKNILLNDKHFKKFLKNIKVNNQFLNSVDNNKYVLGRYNENISYKEVSKRITSEIHNVYEEYKSSINNNLHNNKLIENTYKHKVENYFLQDCVNNNLQLALKNHIKATFNTTNILDSTVDTYIKEIIDKSTSTKEFKANLFTEVYKLVYETNNKYASDTYISHKLNKFIHENNHILKIYSELENLYIEKIVNNISENTLLKDINKHVQLNLNNNLNHVFTDEITKNLSSTLNIDYKTKVHLVTKIQSDLKELISNEIKEILLNNNSNHLLSKQQISTYIKEKSLEKIKHITSYNINEILFKDDSTNISKNIEYIQYINELLSKGLLHIVTAQFENIEEKNIISSIYKSSYNNRTMNLTGMLQDNKDQSEIYLKKNVKLHDWKTIFIKNLVNDIVEHTYVKNKGKVQIYDSSLVLSNNRFDSINNLWDTSLNWVNKKSYLNLEKNILNNGSVLNIDNVNNSAHTLFKWINKKSNMSKEKKLFKYIVEKNNLRTRGIISKILNNTLNIRRKEESLYTFVNKVDKKNGVINETEIKEIIDEKIVNITSNEINTRTLFKEDISILKEIIYENLKTILNENKKNILKGEILNNEIEKVLFNKDIYELKRNKINLYKNYSKDRKVIEKEEIFLLAKHNYEIDMYSPLYKNIKRITNKIVKEENIYNKSNEDITFVNYDEYRNNNSFKKDETNIKASIENTHKNISNSLYYDFVNKNFLKKSINFSKYFVEKQIINEQRNKLTNNILTKYLTTKELSLNYDELLLNNNINTIASLINPTSIFKINTLENHLLKKIYFNSIENSIEKRIEKILNSEKNIINIIDKIRVNRNYKEKYIKNYVPIINKVASDKELIVNDEIITLLDSKITNYMKNSSNLKESLKKIKLENIKEFKSYVKDTIKKELIYEYTYKVKKKVDYFNKTIFKEDRFENVMNTNKSMKSNFNSKYSLINEYINKPTKNNILNKHINQNMFLKKEINNELNSYIKMTNVTNNHNNSNTLIKSFLENKFNNNLDKKRELFSFIKNKNNIIYLNPNELKNTDQTFSEIELNRYINMKKYISTKNSTLNLSKDNYTFINSYVKLENSKMNKPVNNTRDFVEYINKKYHRNIFKNTNLQNSDTNLIKSFIEDKTSIVNSINLNNQDEFYKSGVNIILKKEIKEDEQVIKKVTDENKKLQKILEEKIEKISKEKKETINVSTISEKVYKNIERRLKNERQRRGLI